MRSIPRNLLLLVLLCVVSGCGGRPVPGGQEALDAMTDDKVLASELLAQGNYQGVVDVLAPWIARKARDPEVYAMTAKAQWKLERHTEAVRNYEEALRLDYSNAYTHMELAQVLVATGKTGRALTEFELSVQNAGRDPLPYYNYGLALREMGRGEEALREWKIAHSLAPGDPKFAEALGIGLAGTDDAAALRFFEKADSLGADHAGFHNNYGLLLQRLGDYARAESEFKEALAMDARNVAYRRNLGLLYMVFARYDLALAIWGDLLGEDASDPVYRIYLARAQLELGLHDAAIEVLEGWVAEIELAQPPDKKPADYGGGRPGIDEAYDVLAMSYRGRGDLGRAAAAIRRALEIAPARADYLTNYGVILAESGNIAEAKELWKKALEIDPDNATARQNLSFYER